MVETVGLRWVMWIVMLESTKDQILGVDILGQQVPPRVQYGTACLLIRDDVGSVPYSDEWELASLLAWAHTVQVGSWYHDYPRKS
jgi:hypothetical protein